VNILKPGDIVFYPDTGKFKHKIFTWLQKLGNEMGDMEELSFTHVGMISTEPDLMIEMKWPRPSFSFFGDDMRPKVIMRPKCGDEYKIRAIYWCYFNINERYSFLNMLFGKFGLTKAHKVCSAWVDMAYKMAGYPLTCESDSLVSPNELASSGSLEIIQGGCHG